MTTQPTKQSRPHLVATTFIESVDDVVKIRADKDSDKIAGFAVWSEGQWRRVTPSVIKENLTRMIISTFTELSRIQSLVNEAYAIICAMIGETHEKDWDQSVKSLPFADGNKSLCLETHAVIDTPKDHRMLVRMAVTSAEFENGATTYETSRFKDFIADWLADPYRRDVVQMAFGQALAGNPAASIMDAWGTGRNGKGALFQFAQAALGDYVVSIDTSYFAHGAAQRHEAGLVKLKHGRIAIIGEFEAAQKVDTGRLKSMASHEAENVSYKGKDPFEIHPKALFVIHGNAVLQMRDKSVGIKRRWLTVKFQHEVPEGAEISPSIMADIATAERGAFLHWMLEGLKKYHANAPDNGGSYGNLGTVATDRNEYFDNENPVISIVERLCVKSCGERIELSKLLEDDEASSSFHSMRAFRRALQESGYTASNQNKRKVLMLADHRLKTDAEIRAETGVHAAPEDDNGYDAEDVPTPKKSTTDILAAAKANL